MICKSWLSIILVASTAAGAQTSRMRVIEEPWSGFMRYSALSDYAETEKPRGYTHSLRGGATYRMTENWSTSLDASLGFQTFDGQIEKGQEQSHTETLNPSAALELDYEHKLGDSHVYTLFVHGEPLLDAASRLEGYRGIIGLGGSLDLAFFKRRYNVTQVLDISSLLNTYRYALDTSANPDVFYTYKLVNSVRLFAKVRFGYTWGIKLTQYTDHFLGYSYNNIFSLSTGIGRWTLALAYENGGFTDNGEVRLWYVDQYRRVAMVSMNYTF